MRLVTLFSVLAMVGTGWAADWPSYSGADANRIGQDSGQALIERMSDARLVWQSEAVIPLAKAHCARSNQCPAGRHNNEEGQRNLPSGGGASPIVYHDKVYISYYKPCGPDMADKGVRGATSDGDRYIAADDVVVCMDAQTGKTLWTMTEPGIGVSHQGMKSPGRSGESACASNGRVFAVGSSWMLYALNADNGEVLWKRPLGEMHERAIKARAQAIAKKSLVSGIGAGKDSGHNPLAVGDVLLVPHSGVLYGIDAATGKELWKRGGVVGKAQTPSIWHHHGRSFVICKQATKVVCIDIQNGEILWDMVSETTNDRHMCLVDDVLVVRSPEMVITGRRGNPTTLSSLAAYSLSLSGPTELWNHKGNTALTLHDYWGEFIASKKHVFLATNSGVDQSPNATVMCDLRTGQVINTLNTGLGWMNNVAHERLIGIQDGRHMNITLRMFSIVDGQLVDSGSDWSPPIPPTSGYAVVMTHAYADGRLYIRGGDGIYCFDLRK